MQTFSHETSIGNSSGARLGTASRISSHSYDGTSDGRDVKQSSSIHQTQPAPSLEEYRFIVSCKTTIIFRLGLLMLMIYSDPQLMHILKCTSNRSNISNLPSTTIYTELLEIIEDIGTNWTCVNPEPFSEILGTRIHRHAFTHSLLGYWFQIRDDYYNITMYKDLKVQLLPWLTRFFPAARTLCNQLRGHTHMPTNA